MSDIEIALFPIPGSVALPFSKVPLHVFEPRYRKMIHDSIAEKRLIAVMHTQKVIADSKIPAGAELAEILNKNQKTYLPHSIFSAGFARLLETLPDGRMLVEIEMSQRYQLLEELQSVPYKIARCRPFNDEPEQPVDEIRKQLDAILIGLIDDTNKTFKAHLKSEQWLNQTDIEYSFKIYQLVEMDPDSLQKVLELKLASERISFMLDVLTRGPLQ